MTAAEKIDVEIAKLEALLARRGAFHEDERDSYRVFVQVRDWLKEDKQEAERIELEAMEAEEQERIEREANDPAMKTRKLFEGVHIKVPEKGSRK